jgi:Rab GDP dissociation inhibitor
VCMVSFSHNVAAAGKYVAIASTTVETSDPISELAPAFEIIGSVLERFDTVSEAFEPVGSGQSDKCYISSSYDATSHFETTSQDILSLYERITGQQLDLTINADSTDAEDS